MASHAQLTAVVNPIIFREYIGVKAEPESLDDFPAQIINEDIDEFHFILGFAREVYDHGKGTGNFHRHWNFNYFSPAKVAKLKKEHKNVKVIISIGGHGAEYPFDPQEKRLWIYKAVHSIKALIQDYENHVNLVKGDDCHCDTIIDGIDINYEYINSSDGEFSTCIGQVIKQLKKHFPKAVDVVSIAPTELVQQKYRQLYWDNKHNINWVDYKFYNHAMISSKEEFVALFDQLVTDYGTEVRLLAGVSTDPDCPTKMKREVFVEGCISLLNTSSLSGIFLWNANDSAMPKKDDTTPFFLEEMLQSLLIIN